jgi:hypothetical protein
MILISPVEIPIDEILAELTKNGPRRGTARTAQLAEIGDSVSFRLPWSPQPPGPQQIEIVFRPQRGHSSHLP